MTSTMKSLNSRRGFTLIELLVVMIIALMLMFMALMMFNEMFRGQEVRTAGRLVEQAMSDARQLSAEKGTQFYVRLSNSITPDRGTVQTFADTNRSGAYEVGTDQLVPGGQTDLPKFCFFGDTTNGLATKMYPDMITLVPTGYARYTPAAYGVQRGNFDSNFNLASPSIMGDIVVVVKGKPHKLCLDIDTMAGKVRRQEYLHIP
ncbi:MAG TPA: type II secretion system protein [Planctomycetota bacterium]|nr:type II secretion system protein [Planctomycetota bacterium]